MILLKLEWSLNQKKLNLADKLNILEIGSGDGFILKYFLDKFKNLIEIENLGNKL